MQPFAFICSLVACCQIDAWDALKSAIPAAITVFFQGPKRLLQNAQAVPALNTMLATRVPQLISLLNVLAECSPEHARTQTVAALQRPTAEQDLQVRTCKRVVSHNGRLNPCTPRAGASTENIGRFDRSRGRTSAAFVLRHRRSCHGRCS